MPVVVRLFFTLCIGHALADFPWQGDFLSKGKNRVNPLPGVPWYWCLGAHAAINAGLVWLITGSGSCAWLEFVAHLGIDDMKCEGIFGFNVDQCLHLACKALWAAAAVYYIHSHFWIP